MLAGLTDKLNTKNIASEYKKTSGKKMPDSIRKTIKTAHFDTQMYPTFIKASLILLPNK